MILYFNDYKLIYIITMMGKINNISVLNEEVRFCYENGIRFFYVGCAVGFDMMAAYAVLEQKVTFMSENWEVLSS